MTDDFEIDDLVARIQSYGDSHFLISQGKQHSYRQLSEEISQWQSFFKGHKLDGQVVGLVADYTLQGISALIALWTQRAIVALVPQHAATSDEYRVAGHLDSVLDLSVDAEKKLVTIDSAQQNALIDGLRSAGNPGLILFSSGSSGQPKAVLHDLHRFIGKFSVPGKKLTTLAFLVFDHVAGQDTLLYSLCAGACLVAADSRRPNAVAKLIEKHAVEVLPTSPSFLNLLLVSGTSSQYDFGSVQIITYGSEPMGQSTLQRLTDEFPNARIIQKYGTTEFGALRSQSRSNSSLFIEIKDDEAQFQIREGLLWIKTKGAMLGYLNAASSADEDGWICTGDLVEQEGDWLHVLGRASDLINVGGEKVVPAEVEAVILQLDEVTDATVKGEKNPLLGSIVIADIVLKDPRSAMDAASKRSVVKAIRRHCAALLPPYKIPAKFNVSAHSETTDRQKKIRR